MTIIDRALGSTSDPLFPVAAFFPLGRPTEPSAGTGVSWTPIQPGTARMDDSTDYVDDENEV